MIIRNFLSGLFLSLMAGASIRVLDGDATVALLVGIIAAGYFYESFMQFAHNWKKLKAREARKHEGFNRAA